MAIALYERQEHRVAVAPKLKSSHADGRASNKAIVRYAKLARDADAGKTIDVTNMSDDEILKLIRR